MNIKVSALVAAALLCGGLTQASAATLSFDNVQFPGTGVPLSVTASDGTVFTFSAGPSSQFQSFTSGGIGSFPAGVTFLAAGLGNSAPINVSFSVPLSSISIPVSSDRVGNSPFTSTVQFFNGASSVGSSTQSGNTLNPPLTFSFSGAATTSALISTSAMSLFGFTQNIGPITFERASSVVVPGPIAGAGIPALMALGGFVWARRRKAAAVS